MATEFEGNAPKDIVKGWNEKRLSNNQVISALTPFCQLIAIYDRNKIGEMFGVGDNKELLTSVSVSDSLEGGRSYNAEVTTGQLNKLQDIKDQIKKASFNLYVVETGASTVNFTPKDAIILGKASSQVSDTEDTTGGVGISDFQIEHGQTNVLASRTWKMRLTIPNPSILDKQYQYNNLSVIGSEFLIIYGWANPKNINGFDATPPPILEPDPSDGTRQMMVVGTGDGGNGGYWSSARVSLQSYDFSFNEVGQLEVSLVFNYFSTLALLSTRVSAIAPIFNQLIGSADDSEDRSFLNYMITASDGQQVAIKDAVLYEQQRMELKIQDKNATMDELFEASSVAAGAEGQVVITALGENSQNKPLRQILQENAAAEGSYSNRMGPVTNTADAIEKQTNEARGFPHAVGLSTYTKKQVIDQQPADTGVLFDETDDSGYEETDETNEEGNEEGEEIKLVDHYEIKSTHIFLGWVLESIRLAYSETNRVRMGAGERTYNPSFHYLANTSDSQLNAVFQNKFRRANRSSSIEERIQEAIMRLKERCLPPTPRLRNPSRRTRGDQQKRFGSDDAGLENLAKHYVKEYYKVGSGQEPVLSSPEYTPCLGIPIIEGVQTEETRRLAQQEFPVPEGARSLANVPMRGFVFQDGRHQPGGGDRVDKWVYKPDWYVQEATETIEDENGNEIEISKRTGGSPEGFQPDSPSLYKAAAAPAGRGGRFFYQIKYKVEAIANTTRTGYVVSALGGLAACGPIGATAGLIGAHSRNQKADQSVYVVLLIDVDEYRRRNKEIWHNTQLWWHGLHIRYLITYFERTIRSRVNEVLDSGGVLEDIYLEPIDLDFLTGKVFRNFKFMGGRHGPGRERFEPKPFNDLPDRGVDGDLIDDANRLQNELPILQERRTSLLTEMGGNNSSIDRASAMVNEINELKAEIETLCGGRYERLEPQFSGSRGEPATRDMLNNPILSNFKNWRRVIRGGVNESQSGQIVYERRMVEATVYFAIDDYHFNDGTPLVTLDWVIWRYYYNNAYEFGNNRVPTNNFQFAKFGPRDESGEFFDLSNKQSRWIARNPADYENAQKRVEENQTLINQKLEIISAKESRLQTIYRDHRGYTDAIKIVDERIASNNRKLESYTRFFDDEKNEKELSPYDDTSAFDDVLEVNMARHEPMVLTSKVAQQWYKRFKGLQYNGVEDVYNYGPPKGGKEYYVRSNNKRFKKFDGQEGQPIRGYPKRVLDPEYGIRFGNRVGGWGLGGVSVFLNLSNGVENLDTSSSKEGVGNQRNVDGVVQYLNWTAFGSPGAPDRDGNNQWGYTYGIPTEEELAGGFIKKAGGNYVKNYGEFCDLFELVFDPSIEGSFPKINGSWPNPPQDEKDNNGQPLILYTMIDDDNNIIKPDGEGYYVQTGWKLVDDGSLIYLYPSRAKATKVDPSTGKPIEYGFPGAWGYQGAETPEKGKQEDSGDRNYIHWDAADNDEATDKKGGEGNDARSYKWAIGKNNGLPEGQWRGVPLDFNGNQNYGFRIGRGNHCPNFTLDMKRSLVINRPNARDNTYMLGKDLPQGTRSTNETNSGTRNGEPSRTGPNGSAPGKIDWDQIGPAGSAANGKRQGAQYQNADGQIGYAEGRDSNNFQPQPIIDTTGRCKVVGPRSDYTSPYSNPQYPYGTGAYRKQQEYGSYSFPERSPNKNYLYIGDFLETLADYGSGFRTRINNNNYSPTMLLADGTIVDGEEIDVGFVNFIVQNVLAVLPNNRRIMTRKKVESPQVIDAKVGKQNGWRLHDPTYYDLFGKLEGDDEDAAEGPVSERSYADLTNFKVDNVADIPIRRDILQNLMNKNNKNMSVMQFIGEIFRPEATDVMTNNVNVAGRQTSDGTFQIYQANKNFKAVANLMKREADKAVIIDRYPENFILFDYRGGDSLIENLNMSSKYDPMMGFVFESAALNFSNPENFAQFLSASNGITVANELKAFLAEEFKATASTRDRDVNISSEPSGNDWGDYIVVNAAEGTVKFDKDKIFGKTEMRDGKEAKGIDRVVPQSVLTKFLTADPMRMGRMKALIQAQAGDNFATQLMSTYMYKASIVIHGTTGLIPGTNVLIRGIFQGLEGLYRIVKVREQITPQNFQTFLDLQLLVAGDKEGEHIDDEIKDGMIK